MLLVDSTLPCGDIALEETLDGKNPLRHLMHDNGLEGVISSEGLARSSTSVSELLTILPQQSHSVSDGLLKFSFSHEWEGIPRPVSVSLFVDASPGCGGLAWPAGQVLLRHFALVASH
jgi:protein N-lysine methyltransferase METTL21A